MREKGIRTRERVLAGAEEIFHRRGFSGTSVNDLILETGVKKGNLYHYFSSKEEIGRVVLANAAEKFYRFLEMSLQGDSPSVQLANYFEATVRYHERRDLIGGCLFGNAALEMCDRNDKYRDVINAVFEEWKRRIRTVLENAVTSGEIPKGIDPEAMARHVVATVEGGIMLARAGRNPADLEACLATLYRVLGFLGDGRRNPPCSGQGGRKAKYRGMKQQIG
jgi:TetR/AcrR family transcriptional repressor of nem operon